MWLPSGSKHSRPGPGHECPVGDNEVPVQSLTDISVVGWVTSIGDEVQHINVDICEYETQAKRAVSIPRRGLAVKNQAGGDGGSILILSWERLVLTGRGGGPGG